MFNEDKNNQTKANEDIKILAWKSEIPFLIEFSTTTQFNLISTSTTIIRVLFQLFKRNFQRNDLNLNLIESLLLRETAALHPQTTLLIKALVYELNHETVLNLRCSQNKAPCPISRSLSFEFLLPDKIIYKQEKMPFLSEPPPPRGDLM